MPCLVWGKLITVPFPLEAKTNEILPQDFRVTGNLPAVAEDEASSG